MACDFRAAGREARIDFAFGDGGSAPALAMQPNVKLSGRQQRGALDSERKMGRRPCARWPARRAVGFPLERRVRPRAVLGERGLWHERSFTRPWRAQVKNWRSCCRGLTRLGWWLHSRRPRSAPVDATVLPRMATVLKPAHLTVADVTRRLLMD